VRNADEEFVAMFSPAKLRRTWNSIRAELRGNEGQSPIRVRVARAFSIFLADSKARRGEPSGESGTVTY